MVTPLNYMSTKNPDNFVESLNQDESIEFTIEYKDGKEEKGKL